MRRILPIIKRVDVRTDMMNYDLDDQERTSMLMGHFPHGTSIRNINHVGQLIGTGQFRFFDFGAKKLNTERYGQAKPPLIPLERVPADVPIAMFAGSEDQVVPIEGNRELREIFRTAAHDPVVEYQEVEADHMTFVLGKDMSYFDRVVDLVDRYNRMDEGRRNKVVEEETKQRLTKVDRTLQRIADVEASLVVQQKDKKQ